MQSSSFLWIVQVCVCVDQIAATWHLALAPIRVVSHSEELVLVQNLLTADIVRQQAVTQFMEHTFDHLDRISKVGNTYLKVLLRILFHHWPMKWPCDFCMILLPSHPLWWRWSDFICWQATSSCYNMCARLFSTFSLVRNVINSFPLARSNYL